MTRFHRWLPLALSLTAPVVACARPVLVAPSSAAPTALPGTSSLSGADQVATAPDRDALYDPSAEDSVPTVVVRTYRGSPYVNVVAWGGENARYGLRTSVRQDGTMPGGMHALFIGADNLRAMQIVSGGDWSIFPVGSEQGRPVVLSRVVSDVASCEGDAGCTPFHLVGARVEDALLRRSAATGLEVRVYGRTGGVERVMSLSPAVVSAYLATVDSVAARRRAAMFE